MRPEVTYTGLALLLPALVAADPAVESATHPVSLGIAVQTSCQGEILPCT